MKFLPVTALFAALMLSSAPSALAQSAGTPVMSADELACRTMGVGPDCVAVIVAGDPNQPGGVSAPSPAAQEQCDEEDRKADGTCTPIIDMGPTMRGSLRYRSIPGVSVVPSMGVVTSAAASLPAGVPRVNMPKSDVSGFVARTDPRKAQTVASVRQALSDPTAICKSAVQASTSANGFANLCIQFDNATTNFTNPAWAETQLANVVQMLSRDDVRNAQRVEVEIMGHANRTGSEGINDTLSRARAEKVRQWLQVRVPTNVVVKSDGRGFWQPVSFADPRDGVNRRVEMKVTRVPATLQ